jgi:hypothetical protein
MAWPSVVTFMGRPTPKVPLVFTPLVPFHFTMELIRMLELSLSCTGIQVGRELLGDKAIANHLIACGLIGEPVAPVITSGGPQKKNS